MTRQFHNRVALVTGGSRGIGAAIVRRLASDGASVAFTYSSSEKQALELVSEVEEAGGMHSRSRPTAQFPRRYGVRSPALWRVSAGWTSL